MIWSICARNGGSGQGDALFRRPFNLGQVTGSIDDPHHLRAVFRQPVKRQPSFDNKRPRALGNFWTRPAELWMMFQSLASLFDAVVDRIGNGL